ncbi:hypothetical protein PENTCL1PPCAC_5487, partial [Pristionchus entomophagus]
NLEFKAIPRAKKIYDLLKLYRALDCSEKGLRDSALRSLKRAIDCDWDIDVLPYWGHEKLQAFRADLMTIACRVEEKHRYNWELNEIVAFVATLRLDGRIYEWNEQLDFIQSNQETMEGKWTVADIIE